MHLNCDCKGLGHFQLARVVVLFHALDSFFTVCWKNFQVSFQPKTELH